MELNSDLLGIQSLTSNLTKKIGDFTKIRYPGGNEEKILNVTVAMQEFFISKNYFKNRTVNEVFEKQIEDILLFIMINMDYKRSLFVNDLQHLTNIMPQWSKCLFVNVVYGLDLIPIWCKALQKLPVQVSSELCDEIYDCLKRAKPKEYLTYVYTIVDSMKIVLQAARDNQDSDDVENLESSLKRLLGFLTGIKPEEIKSKKQLYLHMGLTLNTLFDLLLTTDINNPKLEVLTDSLIKTTASVFRSVTINVFVIWAEEDGEDGKCLQLILAEKAYQFIEKFQKHKCEDAKILIQMFSTMAKKPRTLQEEIYNAEIPTMVKKIRSDQENRQKWLQALLNRNFQNHPEVIECIESYCHLLDESDVLKIMSTNYLKKEDGSKLVLKCSKALSSEQLVTVLTRYYHSHGFSNVFTDSEQIQQSLVIVFNKLEGSSDSIKTEVFHSLFYLMLQNPPATIKFMFDECLKNSFYTNALKEVFEKIRGFSNGDFAVNLLNETVKDKKLTQNSLKHFIYFFNVLIEVGFFTCSQVLYKILFNWFSDDLEQLNYCLQITYNLQIKVKFDEDAEDFILALFGIMKGRCKFLEFNSLKQDNLRLVIEILDSKFARYESSELEDCMEKIEDHDNYFKFYKLHLKDIASGMFLKTVCPNFDLNNYAAAVCLIIKVLPRCVQPEWKRLYEEVTQVSGRDKTLELFTDALLLLNQVVDTQRNSDQNVFETVLKAMKYCLQNYGIIVKKTFTDIPETSKIAAGHVCRLIRYIPEELKQEEGLNLANAIPEECLKSLSGDKKFVHSVAQINHPQICQVLASKMLKQ